MSSESCGTLVLYTLENGVPQIYAEKIKKHEIELIELMFWESESFTFNNIVIFKICSVEVFCRNQA